MKVNCLTLYFLYDRLTIYIVKKFGVRKMQNNEITRITPKRGLFSLKLKELIKYKDLIFLFVKRDFVTNYKQTLLGPLWIVISPLLSTIVFTVIFGMIANISTDGMPQFLFYMSGSIMWSFFSVNLSRASSMFLSNARLFSKVYFPRLSMSVSAIVYNTINFIIQFITFEILCTIFMATGANIRPNLFMLFIPLLLIQSALLGTGVGLIICSVTAKYRDLNILVGFGIQLWMYLTPIVYPISQIPQNLRRLFLLNPTAPIIECFRYSVLGSGSFPTVYLLISLAVTLILLVIGMTLFNQVEKNFIDMV